MLTKIELDLLRDFISNPENYCNIYGAFTLPNKGGVLIINNKGELPINYFLIGDHINGLHLSVYTHAILTKKNRHTSETHTIVLPEKKN